MRHSAQLFVGASSKTWLGYQQSVSWLHALRDELSARPGLYVDGPQVFVIPAFPVLETALQIFAGTPVWVGAQNCAPALSGPMTGEVTPSFLAEMGVRMVEVGHAERRSAFGEDDGIVAGKVGSIAAAGLTALLCVGEPVRADPGSAARVCVEQVRSAVRDEVDPRSLVVAYEPIWAIGAQQAAEGAYVDAVVGELRAGLQAAFGGFSPPVIYGGSAGPGTLAQMSAIDGLFLGRFAHDARAFAEVIDEAMSASIR